MLDTHARGLVQPLFDRAARLLLYWGVRADQVTWLALFTGVQVGLWIYYGYPVIAVGALWLSGVLDAIDGSLARMQQRVTPWGTLIDLTFDRLVEVSVIIGLALRYPAAQFWLLLLTAGIMLSMTVFLTVGALSVKQGSKSFYYQAGLAERTEGFILFTLMILLPASLVWITIIFFAVILFTAMQRLIEAGKILTINLIA